MERVVFEIILEQIEEEQKAGRNVATSGQREEEVNKWPTSRRQREFCLNIIKSKRTRNQGGIEKRTDEGTESIAAATQISGEETFFCIFFVSKKTTDGL